MEFHKHTLANGLQVIAEKNAEAHSTAMGFFVEAGARDESLDVAGVSHFLEHMVFKGTPTRSADDVNRQFDALGANYNAFTSEEHTVYYASVLPEYQTETVELLGDIMRPALREEDFNTEKQVIIEEIRMYEDQPPFGADDKIKARFFGRHPLGQSVLGTVDSITALRADAMRRYFERRYSPSNIALVATGSVDFPALVDAAERVCGRWQRFDAPRVLSDAQTETGMSCLHKATATQEYVLQLAGGPDAADARRFAAKILATVLGDDSGSRLYWELVDSGLAEQASLSHYEYQGVGLYMAYITCDPQQAADNLRRSADIFAQAEASGITAAELAQAKSKINARVVLGSERPRGRLFSVGGNWLQRREYRTVDDDLRSVDAVTVDDVAAVLAAFPLTRAMVMAVGPLAEI